MADQNKLASVGEYYLQVQALSEVSGSVKEEVVIPVGEDELYEQLSFFPIAIGVALLLLVLAIIVDRHNRANKIFNHALKLAVVVMLIPLGVKVIQKPVGLMTKAGPDTVPQNLIVEKVTESMVLMSWETQTPTTAMIKIWPLDKEDGPMRVVSESRTGTETHQLLMEGLQTDTEYGLLVMSNSKWYGDGGMPIVIRTAAE